MTRITSAAMQKVKLSFVSDFCVLSTRRAFAGTVGTCVSGGWVRDSVAATVAASVGDSVAVRLAANCSASSRAAQAAYSPRGRADVQTCHSCFRPPSTVERYKPYRQVDYHDFLRKVKENGALDRNIKLIVK